MTPAARLAVVLDVQHAYRPWPHAKDRGAVFTLESGARVTEFELARRYADAADGFLSEAGVAVLTNNPGLSGNRAVGPPLVGTYTERGRQAAAWGATLFLACHINADAARGRYALAGVLAPQSPGPLERARQRAAQLAGALVLELDRDFPAIVGGQVKMLRRLSPPSFRPTPTQPIRWERGTVCIRAAALAGVPAVLFEPFFGDTPAHQRQLATEQGLEQLGELIARTVLDWHRASL